MSNSMSPAAVANETAIMIAAGYKPVPSESTLEYFGEYFIPRDGKPDRFRGPVGRPARDYGYPIFVKCECVNWARDGRDMSPHHPRCKHHTPEPPDPRYAVFGRLMWDLFRQEGEEFFWDEWSERVLPLAQKAGLCQRVAYDPEKHGAISETNPGDSIWFWGEEKEGA